MDPDVAFKFMVAIFLYNLFQIAIPKNIQHNIFVEKDDVNFNLQFDDHQGWQEDHYKDSHHHRF